MRRNGAVCNSKCDTHGLNHDKILIHPNKKAKDLHQNWESQGSNVLKSSSSYYSVDFHTSVLASNLYSDTIEVLNCNNAFESVNKYQITVSNMRTTYSFPNSSLLNVTQLAVVHINCMTSIHNQVIGWNRISSW